MAQRSDMVEQVADTHATASYKAALPSFIGHSLFLFCVALVAAALFYQYWYGEYGRHELDALRAELSAQEQANLKQQQKLDRLRADVADLKSGLLATEEHARIDLGLIKSGETFVQLAHTPEDYAPLPAVENDTPAIEVLDVEAVDGVPVISQTGEEVSGGQ